MMENDFRLNARLAEDSAFVAALPLCELRLMREARWFWLILVPRVKNAEELFDLSEKQRMQLMAEINAAAAALAQAAKPCGKINIGALGNIVRQLHIHIVARAEGDAAWPNPVWGQGTRQEPNADLMAERMAALPPLSERR